MRAKQSAMFSPRNAARRFGSIVDSVGSYNSIGFALPSPCGFEVRRHFAEPDGTWAGLGDAIRRADMLVYRVAPVTGFCFGKGTPFSQTRWGFS